MLKKIAYSYLLTALVTLLLLLIGGPLDSATDFAFLLSVLGCILLMFLIWTSPICLLVLVLLMSGRSLRRLLEKAERFHSGSN
jgi:predicted ABC-type exoprotein transport system permease subunit